MPELAYSFDMLNLRVHPIRFPTRCTTAVILSNMPNEHVRRTFLTIEDQRSPHTYLFIWPLIASSEQCYRRFSNSQIDILLLVEKATEKDSTRMVPSSHSTILVPWHGQHLSRHPCVLQYVERKFQTDVVVGAQQTSQFLCGPLPCLQPAV